VLEGAEPPRFKESQRQAVSLVAPLLSGMTDDAALRALNLGGIAPPRPPLREYGEDLEQTHRRILEVDADLEGEALEPRPHRRARDLD
jgi:hypothetical protein